MLAQAGIPLTGGFIAKLEIFSATAQAGEYVLLVDRGARGGRRRVLLPADRDDAAHRTRRRRAADRAAGFLRRVDNWSAVVLLATAVLVLVVGVVPGTFIHWARDATFLL